MICSLEVKVQVISFREDSPEDVRLFPGNYVCRLPLKKTLFWRVKVVVNAVKVRSSIMVWIPVKQRERERRREREREERARDRERGKGCGEGEGGREREGVECLHHRFQAVIMVLIKHCIFSRECLI